jgi:hypothetical protein
MRLRIFDLRVPNAHAAQHAPYEASMFRLQFWDEIYAKRRTK